jgi:hypothetical protein
MYLVMLMLFPVLIGTVGLFWSKGRITIKEFLTLEAASFAIVGIGFLVARWTSTADWELWNGRVSGKDKVWVSCSHSYPCNPHPCMCDKNGCSTCWDTCYEHSNDWDWDVYTTNGETITIDRIDRRGSYEPPRWTRARIGEPTAVQHRCTNYIKAHPESVLRLTGSIEQFKSLIPEYPIGVYDYHYSDRFVSVGVSVPDANAWNRDLQEVNADLGKKKEVNIIVVVANTNDLSYQYALEEAWIGGKKNDLIVIMGVTSYPVIDWVGVMSWSEAENLKVELRDDIKDIGTIDQRAKIMTTIKTMVDQKFVRKHMSDFKYLMAGAQPGSVGTMILFVLGILTSVGLSVYFYSEDPFDSGYHRY